MRSCFRPWRAQRALQRGTNWACVWTALAVSFLSVKITPFKEKQKRKSHRRHSILHILWQSCPSAQDNLPLSPLMPARPWDIFPLHKSFPWLRGRSGKQPLGEAVPEKPASQARGIFSLRYKANKGLTLIATAREFLAPSSAKKRDYENHAGEDRCLEKAWTISLGSSQLC